MRFESLARILLCLAGLMPVLATPGLGQSAAQPRVALRPPGGRAPQVEAAAPSLNGALADTTLRYYDLSGGVFDFDLGGDFRALGSFFTAPFDGTLDRVDFELSNVSNPPGIRGTGTLRVKLVPTEALIDPRSPGVDSLDLDFSALSARGVIQPGNLSNRVDVSGAHFDLVKDREYFLQLALVDASADAALSFVFDRGTKDSTDARYFPARSFVYVLAASAPDTMDGYKHFVDNPNFLLELQLTRTPLPPPLATGRVQFIHGAPTTGAVDVYVGGQRVVDDLSFRQASPFVGVPAGEQPVDVVAGSDATNDNPIFTTTATIAENASYLAVALGRPGQDFGVTFEGPGAASGGGKKFTLISVHGGVDAGPLDFRILDDTAEHGVTQVLADDLAFGAVSAPVDVDPGILNVEVSTADTGAQLAVYRLDLTGIVSLGDETLVLLASGILGGDPPLNLVAVRANGAVLAPAVTTAADTAELPAAFALHGAYPNPFRLTTTILFDLGRQGFTTLRVYNVLGREVAVLVADRLPAGRHEVVFDASGLSSGPYVLRLESGGFVRQEMLMRVR